MKFLLSFLFVSSFTLRAFAATLPQGIEHIQTLDGIEEYKLAANGLRVLLMPNEGLPVATVMVTYEVGSRNEVTGTTGATHILEHMMFKGTELFNSHDGTDYSAQMERIGARSNATTYFDRTNYYATLPSEYVPLAIELEADRMRNLRIREEDLASEMTVVRNEYERGENSPVRTLIKEIYAAAFVAQPYGHPTIGWRSDIENTSPQKLRAFYNTFYWPENAVLTVIGGLNKAATLKAVVEFYGAVPSAPNPIPVVDTTEPAQLGPRRVSIERTGQVGVVMVAFKVPEGASPDWAALTLIEQILGADKTGRLYRSLEDKAKASATFTHAPQLRDPSLFMLAAYLTPEATHLETEAIILEEIQKLIHAGASEDELARAKSVIQASTVYGRDGPYAIADQINEAIAMGDWTNYVTLPKAIQAVSTADIQRVAAQYFVEHNSTTGWFIPKKTSTVAQLSNAHYGPNYYRDPAIYGPEKNQSEATDDTGATSSAPLVNFSSHMQRTKVAGIDLIAIDLPIESVVSFVGSLAAGDTLSPIDAPTLAGLTASMLDKGTKQNDRFVIAERLDTLGASIGFSADSHSLKFTGKFLREDAGSIMELLAEQLREPAFDPKVLETLKSRQTSGLLQAIDDPDYRADAQTSHLLYPKGHPNYANEIATLIEDLKATTIEDIAQFHVDHYGPKSMCLVFAGDIDFEQLTAAVESAFEGWNGGIDYPKEMPAQLENKAQSERIYIADKTSIAVRFAQNTGIQRTDDDYIPFMIGNYILGGSFNSRLMQEVRKKQGLTYSIRTHHAGDILTPGNWNLSASFSPALLDQGLKATEVVVTDWYENGVSQKEVQAALETLSGSYLVGLSTTGSVAGQVLSFVQRGFEPQYIDEYPKRLSSITTEQVNTTIRKYLKSDLNTVVIAGSLAEPEIESKPTSQQSISIRLDTPDAGWQIEIAKIYRTSENLIVISQLKHPSDIAAAVISTVSDTIEINATDDAPVRHYVLGKTWNWGDTASYTFIDSMDVFGTALNGAKLLYEAK
jgi:zinc protease